MYTIYHIPNIKIGCTKREVSKRVKEQSYTDYEILEIHTDIQTAAHREIELQIQYGYRVDKGSTAYSESFSKKGRNGAKKAIKTQRKTKVGLHTTDKEKRVEWAKLGGNAITKKYGKNWFSERGKKGGGNEVSKLICSKPIIQFDINNSIIAEYKSISEAGRLTGIGFVAISNCLRGRAKTSGGYRWEYKK
jgi:hypothetical protein